MNCIVNTENIKSNNTLLTDALQSLEHRGRIALLIPPEAELKRSTRLAQNTHR